MDQINISFDLEPTKPQCDLTFVVLIDGVERARFDGLADTTRCNITLEESDGPHELSINMSGKTAAHTKIDEAGNIIDDILVNVKDFAMDDIPLGQSFLDHCRYQHDFNGTGEDVDMAFAGIMGCNGRVIFRFHSPVYHWMLENL